MLHEGPWKRGGGACWAFVLGKEFRGKGPPSRLGPPGELREGGTVLLHSALHRKILYGIAIAKDELGFEPPIIKVQVKSTEGKVGDPGTSALYGKVGTGEHGLLVTLGTFTVQARNFERGKSNLRLIDGAQLVDLILSHYEGFDAVYKSLLPLKRVYVPDRGAADNE